VARRQGAALAAVWQAEGCDMDVTIYHNPRCGTSRKTLDLLRQKGIEPKVVEYLKTPPSAAELKRLLGLMGMKARDLVRKKEEAAAKLDLAMAEDRLIAAMVKDPILIERPIVVVGAKARLGRPPEKVLEIL
jgi:arsenate reductase